jgi:hypothetical protein
LNTVDQDDPRAHAQASGSSGIFYHWPDMDG